jgi:hypothetical protein
LLLLALKAGPMLSQPPDSNINLSKIFGNISFNVDIEIVRLELANTPGFHFYHDPNQDSAKVITGSLTDGDSFIRASDNLLVITYSSSEPKRKKKVIIKRIFNYKHEDLAHAFSEYEKLKLALKPFVTSYVERIKTGAQREKINIFKSTIDNATIIVSLIENNNYIHTLSITYNAKWKIQPIEILKVKNM